MGRAKQYLLEQESYVYEETEALFDCPACGKRSDGYVEIPKIDEAHEMDVWDHICVQCVHCDEWFDAEVRLNSAEQKISLDDHPSVEVEFEPVYFDPAQPEDWWEAEFYYDRPSHPSDHFGDAYLDLTRFVAEYAGVGGNHSMNRMIFTQAFSIFETYLCDTFLNLVLTNKDTRNLFIQKFDGFKKVTFSISELQKYGEVSADEILEKRITQIIKEISFHNLPRVMSLFGFYKINIFGNSEDKEFLMKSVELRHHCVHRNGNDLDGNKLNDFTKDYISKILSAMNATVQKVEAGYVDYLADLVGL